MFCEMCRHTAKTRYLQHKNYLIKKAQIFFFSLRSPIRRQFACLCQSPEFSLPQYNVPDFYRSEDEETRKQHMLFYKLLAKKQNEQCLNILSPFREHHFLIQKSKVQMRLTRTPGNNLLNFQQHLMKSFSCYSIMHFTSRNSIQSFGNVQMDRLPNSSGLSINHLQWLLFCCFGWCGSCNQQHRYQLQNHAQQQECKMKSSEITFHTSSPKDETLIAEIISECMQLLFCSSSFPI